MQNKAPVLAADKRHYQLDTWLSLMRLFLCSCFITIAWAFNAAYAQSRTSVEFSSVSCIHERSYNDRCNPLQIKAQLYAPTTPTSALVIISHGSQGLDARHTAYAEAIRSAGIAALVVDHWGSRGIGKAQHDYAANERKGARAFNEALDALRAFEHFSQQPYAFNQFGYIGESAGGVAVLWTSRPYLYDIYKRVFASSARQPNAAVALYPGCNERNATDRFLPIPMLVITGEADNETPAEYCRTYTEWMNSRGGAATFVALPNQHHDFDAPYFAARAPNAENPIKCLSIIEGNKRTWQLTGEVFSSDAVGYRAYQRKCLDAGKDTIVVSGNSGNAKTGFPEWLAFFKSRLVK